MNNVGALALLMPVAIRLAPRDRHAAGQDAHAAGVWVDARRHDDVDRHAAQPDRLRISRTAAGTRFAMFDFSPVGVPVALVGLVFLSLVGWRLVPCAVREGHRWLRDRRLFHRGACALRNPSRSA